VLQRSPVRSHGIAIEQIPVFAEHWANIIALAREEGIRENRFMELMYESAELRAELAKELAQRASNDDDLDNELNDEDDNPEQ
jgi:hypothetical protein